MKKHQDWILKGAGAFFLLLGWQILSLKLPAYVLPSPQAVGQELWALLKEGRTVSAIGISLGRLTTGLLIGAPLGLSLAFLTTFCSAFNSFLAPLLGLLQVVPPVTLLVMALIGLGFSGGPVILMIIVATVPVMAIQTRAALLSIDPDLEEVVRLYGLSFLKKVRRLYLPAIRNSLVATSKVVLANSWKVLSMGEVLTAQDGIGGEIKLARIALEPERILAWTAILIMLYGMSQGLLLSAAQLLRRGRRASSQEGVSDYSSSRE